MKKKQYLFYAENINGEEIKQVIKLDTKADAIEVGMAIVGILHKVTHDSTWAYKISPKSSI